MLSTVSVDEVFMHCSFQNMSSAFGGGGFIPRPNPYRGSASGPAAWGLAFPVKIVRAPTVHVRQLSISWIRRWVAEAVL